MTILWTITNHDGSAFPLAGKDVRLYYTCERGRFEANAEIQGNNVIAWNFLGSEQRALGSYTLTFEILQSDGKRTIKRDLCDAFTLVGKNCEEKYEQGGAYINEGGVITLATELDIYRISPIIPYVVRDENGIAYWYVDGVNTGDRSTGESAYEYAVSKGYQGTEEEFASILALAPTNHDSIIKIEEMLTNKADKTGRYPEMSVGYADDLVGRGESTPAEFSFRASGGKSIKDGAARIKRLRGNSVVWNNMVDTRGYETGFVIREGIKIQQGHKYLLQRSAANDGLYLIPVVDGSENYEMSLRAGEYANIYTSQYTDLINPRVYSESYCGACVISDLTFMFGAGNEPTTIEEYYARKPIVEDEYAYNEGEVIHMTAKAIKSVGDNAIEERNTTITTDGFPGTPLVELNTNDAFIGISSDGYVGAHHINNVEVGNGKYVFDTDAGGYGLGLFVKVLPNERYHWSVETNGRIDVGFYDANRVLISYVTHTNEARTPYNCEYICLCLRDDEDITPRLTFSNIMLTLVHSGWKQDTDAGYQPYWEDKLMFDERIKEHFPDGLKKWDMVYNKNGKGYIVKGTGVVDMGELDWKHDTLNGYRMFRSMDNLLGATPISRDGTNLICARYVDGNELIYTEGLDKSIELNHGNYGGEYEQDFLAVRDTSYTDAASFNAAMAGVMLYYELAEPTIIEYDEPFNLDYRVADFGTEEAIADRPSAPIAADIIYQFNAVDMIRELWLKVQELEKRLGL